MRITFAHPIGARAAQTATKVFARVPLGPGTTICERRHIGRARHWKREPWSHVPGFYEFTPAAGVDTDGGFTATTQRELKERIALRLKVKA